MKPTRLVVVTLCLSLALACSDHSPTAARQEAPLSPQADLIGGLLGATGLVKCSALPYASSTATIGPAGGTISAGPHKLVIPPGALAQVTTITMTAPSGLGVNAVKFQPEGLQFAVPAVLTMSYANCGVVGVLLPKHIAYTDDNLNILYYVLSLNNILSTGVTGKVNHFSDYVVAW